jgi:hypothetical protein
LIRMVAFAGESASMILRALIVQTKEQIYTFLKFLVDLSATTLGDVSRFCCYDICKHAGFDLTVVGEF